MQHLVQSGRARWVAAHFCISDAMGFRKVSDLSDYTVTELVDLIQKASEVLKQKLAEESTDQAVSSGPAASTGVSVPVASEHPLRSPLTCNFHCRICNAQCYRTTEHKIHACYEHRHTR